MLNCLVAPYGSNRPMADFFRKLQTIAYRSSPPALVNGREWTQVEIVSCWSDSKNFSAPLVPNQPQKCYVIDSFSLVLRHRPRFYPAFGSNWTQVFRDQIAML